MTTDSKTLPRLLEIMQQLRDPETGCAWDIKQDFQSISPFTVEEAYEVADAIERGDLEDLCDELGDLLFQVVFHAQMASELGVFTFEDVTQSIVDKMLRRHPHVFGDVVYESEAELKAGWEAIKAEERRRKALRQAARQQTLDLGKTVSAHATSASTPASASASASTPASASASTSTSTSSSTPAPTSLTDSASALDGIARNLPALIRADKLQRRAARVGFDWPEIEPVWDKIDEEISEVREALKEGDAGAIEDELGDLLFTVVNLARHCGVDSEQALQRASNKFDTRFRRVEHLAAEETRPLQNQSLEQLDALWNRAKQEK